MTMWREPGPPFGFWSNGPYGTGAPIFFEDPPYGIYVAPIPWLPIPFTRSHSPVWRTAFGLPGWRAVRVAAWRLRRWIRRWCRCD